MIKDSKTLSKEAKALKDIRDQVDRIHYRLVDLTNRAASVRYDTELLLDDCNSKTNDGGNNHD